MEKQKDTGKVTTGGKILIINNKISTVSDALVNWMNMWLNWKSPGGKYNLFTDDANDM